MATVIIYVNGEVIDYEGKIYEQGQVHCPWQLAPVDPKKCKQNCDLCKEKLALDTEPKKL